MKHRLSGDLSELRPVVPSWIVKDVEVNHARGKSVFAVLYIAYLIDDEQGVDEVAADSETLVRSKRIGMGDQEFVAARDKLGTLFITEHFEAVDPSAGFCGGRFVVGVGCVLQRAHRMKIWKGKLLHGRRGLCRGCWGRREGSRVLGGPNVTCESPYNSQPPGPTLSILDG